MTSTNSPLSPDERLRVAMHALNFFSTSSHDEGLAVLGKVDPPQTMQPFTATDFLEWFKKKHNLYLWPRAAHVLRVLKQLAAADLLDDLGTAKAPFFGRAYWSFNNVSPDQQSGYLWLSSALGAELIIPAYGSASVHITGRDDKGDVVNGSGLLLDSKHVLTNAHVVNDMSVDKILPRPHFRWPQMQIAADAEICLSVVRKKAHPHHDVAVIEIDSSAVSDFEVLPGMAFRNPDWADEAYVFGYPPVPTSIEPALVVQRGEVVNPQVTGWGNEEFFLYSATTRPGNSGGPIVAQDGRVIGIAAHEVLNKDQPSGAFYRGIPTKTLLTALGDIGYGGIAVEAPPFAN